MNLSKLYRRKAEALEQKDIGRVPSRQEKHGIPPRIMQKSKVLARVYYVNHEWKSVFSKSVVVIYMTYIFWILFRDCYPWYEYFYYLTLQGWALELVYFSFSLYLDLLARYYGGAEYISKVSKAFAQALSEVVFAAQVAIFLMFWLVVYPQERQRSVLWELNCHGVSLALSVLDYLYRFTSFSLRNNKYIVIFCICYSAFHYYIVAFVGRQIYPGIDFKSVKSFIIFFSGVALAVFAHKIFYLISNWRWIKEDIKSVIGITQVILLRQNSLDLIVHGVPELGSELFSISTARNTE